MWKSCMQKDGCYRHSQIGWQNKRKAMKVYNKVRLIKDKLKKGAGGWGWEKNWRKKTKNNQRVYKKFKKEIRG